MTGFINSGTLLVLSSLWIHPSVQLPSVVGHAVIGLSRQRRAHPLSARCPLRLQKWKCTKDGHPIDPVASLSPPSPSAPSPPSESSDPLPQYSFKGIWSRFLENLWTSWVVNYAALGSCVKHECLITLHHTTILKKQCLDTYYPSVFLPCPIHSTQWAVWIHEASSTSFVGIFPSVHQHQNNQRRPSLSRALNVWSLNLQSRGGLTWI